MTMERTASASGNGYDGKPASAERKPSVRQVYFLLRLALERVGEDFPETAAEASELIEPAQGPRGGGGVNRADEWAELRADHPDLSDDELREPCSATRTPMDQAYDLACDLEREAALR